MQFSVVKGRVDFLPGAIIERKFHSAYSIHVSFLSAAHRRVPRVHCNRVQSSWLAIHIEEKPQAKNHPEDNERQATIMDDSFLLLLLRFNFGGHHRFKGRGIAHIFPTLIAVMVALRHLGVAERARLHHRYSFPHARAVLCLLVCWHVTSWRISSEAFSLPVAMSSASLLLPTGSRLGESRSHRGARHL